MAVSNLMSTMTPEVREHYSKQLLYVAQHWLRYTRYAKHSTIPAGEGKVINWRVFSRITVAAVPTALTEGTTPSEGSLTVTNVAATAAQYGRWLGFSDQVSMLAIDPVLTENNKLLGINAAETLDVLARNVFAAGTTQRIANGKTIGTLLATDIINETDIKKIRRDLEKNLTPKFGDPETGYYIAIVSPDVYMDLLSLAGFQNTGYYSDPNRIYQGRVVDLYGIKFVCTTNSALYTGGVGSGSTLVGHVSIFFGMEALGDVDVAKGQMEHIYHGLGSSGVNDPLNQQQSQGWKCFYTARILNQNFLVTYVSTATL